VHGLWSVPEVLPGWWALTRVKIGDVVTFERDAERAHGDNKPGRGFKVRYEARVLYMWAGDAIAVLEVINAHAYHPAQPNGGRDLPAKGDKIAQEVVDLVKVKA
jgi:hypothetical protein